MTEAPLLVANLGAEEGAARATAPVARAAALWRSLFAAEGRAQALPWLEAGAGSAFAWLNDEAAARLAERCGRALVGAAPEVVRRVHDKAWALAAARELGLEPPSIAGLAFALEPAECREPEQAATVARRVAGWPAWVRRLVVKPRRGTSGRGLYVAPVEAAGGPGVHAALMRCAARGGVVVEPWLARSQDLSASYWIDPVGGIHTLGSLRLLVSERGGYRGHAGCIGPGGEVGSGSEHDAALRQSGERVAGLAAAAGYGGPCGLDALVYCAPDGESTLRPVVEWNARFTMGIVAIGLLSRALRERGAAAREWQIRFDPRCDEPIRFGGEEASARGKPGRARAPLR